MARQQLKTLFISRPSSCLALVMEHSAWHCESWSTVADVWFSATDPCRHTSTSNHSIRITQWVRHMEDVSTLAIVGGKLLGETTYVEHGMARSHTQRGHHTNNFCELNVRLYKDLVLPRCNAYNMTTLVDFTVTKLESYYYNRLLTFAHSRNTDARLMLQCELRRAEYFTSGHRVT